MGEAYGECGSRGTSQVVGISGAVDYVITPEGSQFSCEHGVAPPGLQLQGCKALFEVIYVYK